jgi:hypothetical protein
LALTCWRAHAAGDSCVSWPSDETSTLARFLESWLADSVKARPKPRTYEGNELIVKKRLVPGLVLVRLVTLTP